MSIKITIPNTSTDYLTFGSANTPTAAQIAGIDSGSSNGQLALYTTASGTSTERARFDASGNVGIGIIAPTQKLEVNNGASDVTVLSKTTGASYASFRVTNSSKDYSMQIRTDVSNAWVLRDETAGANRLVVDTSGNLLVGTTIDLKAPLTVNKAPSSSAYGQIAAVSVAASDVGNAGISVTKYDNVTTTSQVFARFLVNQGGTASGQINANGASAAAFGSYSDSRLKENIVDLPSQLANIMALRPVEYDYIESEGGGHQIGFVAQEVQEIYPDLVGERADGMLTLTDLNKNDARLIKAIQEMKAIIDTQASTITALTARITALENK